MSDREEGFTLVELLIALAISGLMISAICGALIVALRSLSSGGQGVTDSGGAQLVASYLVSDVQSAESIQPTNFTCTASASATTLLEIRATDADAAKNLTNDVVYAVTPTAIGNELTRSLFALTPMSTTCTGVTPTTQILVRAIDTTGTTPNCSPAPCSSATSVGLTIKAFNTKTVSDAYTAYTFTVQGTRRTS